MKRNLLIGLALTAVLAVYAAAQDNPLKARKLTGVTWYEIRQVEFKPGKRAEALKIVNENFVPAAESAGIPAALRFEHQTGDWDLTTIFIMPDGPAELEWEVHPESEKWMAALAQHCGGMDKAAAMRKSYIDTIARVESQLVTAPTGAALPSVKK